MAQIEGHVKVNVNANQAVNEMRQLEKRASELRQEIIKIRKEKIVDTKQIRLLEKELRSVEKTQRELRRQTTDYKAVLKNLSGASLRDLNRAYRQLNAEVQRLDRNTVEWKQKASQLAKIKAEIGSVRQKMRKLEGATSKNKNIIGKLTSGFNKFGGVALTAIAGISASITGIITVLRNMLNIMTDFEDSFTNVLTLLDSKQIAQFGDELEQGAIDTMAKFGLTAQDVNKALFDTISAGVDAGKSLDVLDASATLATAGVTDLSVANDGLTTVINAFKLSTEDATDVANAFFSAQKYGKTTVEELSNNIGQVAPIMNDAGLSYKETLAALAELTKNGLSTAEATTALKGAISSLLKPTAEAEKVLRQYGVPVGATEIKSAGLTETLQALNNMMQQNPDIVAKAIPNLQGFTGVLSLTGESFEDFKVILNQVNNDLGKNSSMMQAYSIKTNTAAFKMRQASAEYRKTILEMKEDLMPVLIKLTSELTGFLKDVTKFYQAHRREIKALGKALFWLSKMIIKVQYMGFTNTFKLLNLLDKTEKKADSFEKKVGKLGALKNKYGEIKDNEAELAAYITELRNNLLSDEKQRNIAELDAWKQTQEKKVHNWIASEEKKKLALELINETYQKKLAELKKQYIDDKIGNIKDNEEELADYITELRNNLLSDEKQRKIAELEVWKQTQEKKVHNWIASEEKKNQALELINETYQKKLSNIEEQYNKKRMEALNKSIDFIKKKEQELFYTREQLIQAGEEKIRKSYDERIAYAAEMAEKDLAHQEQWSKQVDELRNLRDEEVRQYKLQKEEEFQQQIQQVREKYNLVTEQERMQLELKQLDDYYEQKLLTDEEYEKAKLNIIKKYNQQAVEDTQQSELQKLQNIQDNIGKTENIIDAYGNFFKAMKEQELQEVGDNEEAKKQIQKEYADIELAINISKIIANTATAIAKTIAELGGVGAITPAGAALLAAITITGATQLATAINQRAKIRGYEKGGFSVIREQDNKSFIASPRNERGLINKPSILVAENGPEYVIPNEGLQNPVIFSIVSLMEQARQRGSLRYFNIPRKIKGYAEGGFTDNNNINIDLTQDNNNDVIINKLDTLIQLFEDFQNDINNWQKQLSVDYFSFKEADEQMTKLETKSNI